MALGASYKTAQRYFDGDRVDPVTVDAILLALVPRDVAIGAPAGSHNGLRSLVGALFRLYARRWDEFAARVNASAYPVNKPGDLRIAPLRFVSLDVGFRIGAWTGSREIEDRVRTSFDGRIRRDGGLGRLIDELRWVPAHCRRSGVRCGRWSDRKTSSAFAQESLPSQGGRLPFGKSPKGGVARPKCALNDGSDWPNRVVIAQPNTISIRSLPSRRDPCRAAELLTDADVVDGAVSEEAGGDPFGLGDAREPGVRERGAEQRSSLDGPVVVRATEVHVEVAGYAQGCVWIEASQGRPFTPVHRNEPVMLRPPRRVSAGTSVSVPG